MKIVRREAVKNPEAPHLHPFGQLGLGAYAHQRLKVATAQVAICLWWTITSILSYRPLNDRSKLSKSGPTIHLRSQRHFDAMETTFNGGRS